MSARFDILVRLGFARRDVPRGPGLNQKRRKPRGGSSLPLPVTPNRPDNLSGGAAAALEFDG